MELNMIINRTNGESYVALDDDVLQLLVEYGGMPAGGYFFGEVNMFVNPSVGSVRFVPLRGNVLDILTECGLISETHSIRGREAENVRTQSVQNLAYHHGNVRVMWQHEIHAFENSMPKISDSQAATHFNLRGAKCYLSGRISNCQDFKHVFEQYADGLQKAYGIIPVSPVGTSELLMGKDVSYADYLAVDQQLVRISDAIVLLPGWGESKGAQFEYAYARVLGIPVFYAMPDMSLWLLPQEC